MNTECDTNENVDEDVYVKVDTDVNADAWSHADIGAWVITNTSANTKSFSTVITDILADEAVQCHTTGMVHIDMCIHLRMHM